jgi:hypothetical protein
MYVLLYCDFKGIADGSVACLYNKTFDLFHNVKYNGCKGVKTQNSQYGLVYWLGVNGCMGVKEKRLNVIKVRDIYES